MKSFHEFRGEGDIDLQESRLIRKGLGLTFSSASRGHGNKSVQHFKNSQQELSRMVPATDKDNLEVRMNKIEKGLVEMSEGLISIRHQIGSLVSMVNIVILMNERSDSQFKKLMRKR